MRRRALLVAVALPVLLNSGCVIPAFISAFTDTLGREAALMQQQRSYTKFVRWGDIAKAAEFVDPAQREEFLGYEDAFAQYRFTDFEIGEIVFNEEDTTATVRVTYRAYSIRTLVERQVRETQNWVRPFKGNVWFVQPKIEGLLDGLAGVIP